MNTIKVCEIFESIQGEGKYAGVPMLFIRTSGCNRKCWFCDTKYHEKGTDMSIIELIQAIRNSKMKYVCWTGGEPLLWKWEIEKVIEKTRGKHHHLETNGDLLSEEDFLIFQYLAISPKDKATAKKCRLLYRYEDSDIKVVTNLKTVGTDMLVYATMLMPLTTYKKKKDLEIMKNVWVYCCEFNKRYCARIHYFVWGKKKGV